MEVYKFFCMLPSPPRIAYCHFASNTVTVARRTPQIIRKNAYDSILLPV